MVIYFKRNFKTQHIQAFQDVDLDRKKKKKNQKQQNRHLKGAFLQRHPSRRNPSPVHRQRKAGSRTLKTWHVGSFITTEIRVDWNPSYKVSTRPGGQQSSQEASLCRRNCPHPCLYSLLLILSLRAGLWSGACNTPGSDRAPTSHTCKLISKTRSFSLGLPLWCPCLSWMLPLFLSS